MSGLERMIQLIVADGETKAKEILEDARQEEQRILAQARAEGEALKQEMLSQVRAAQEKESEQAKAGAERLYKRQLLQEKQESIGSILAQAGYTFANLSEKTYWQWIEGQLKPLLQGGEGIFYCREEDCKGIPPALWGRLKAMALAKGGTLQIQCATEPVDAGFILAYGQVMENRTLSVLLESRRQEMEDKLNRYLFAETTIGEK